MANRFWVNTAGGNWEDTANWSLISGDVGGASAPTTSVDTAVFDVNSIPFENNIHVGINSAISCHISSEDLASEWMILEINDDGSLSLQEDLLDLFQLNMIDTSTLITNGYTLEMYYCSFFNSATLDLTGSNINLIDADGTLFAGNYGTPPLIVTVIGGTLISDGKDISAEYTNFTDNAATGTSTYSAHANENNFDGGGNTGWDFSSTLLPFTISQSSGTVSVENVNFHDSIATGGATFNAFTSNGNIDGWGNTGWNFTGSPEPIPTYTISGKVKGAIVEGVTIDLTGDATATTTTDVNGNYGFLSLNNGTYVVIPSYPPTEYTFVPTYKDVIILNSSATSIDFATDSVLIGMGIASFTSPMLVGATQQIAAIGYYTDGSEKVITQLVTWVSSDPLVATIDSGGLILALKSGITFISATYGALVSRIMLKVEQIFSNVFAGGTATLQQIPISSDPNQDFTSTVLVGGKSIKLRIFLRWDFLANYWVMSILDSVTQDYYVDGIPLIVGIPPTNNLLQPYGYLGIGSCYVANVSNLPSSIPNSSNLGIDYVLLWGDTEL